jgi:hypothetical protein
MELWSDEWICGQTGGFVVRCVDLWSDGWTGGQSDGFVVTEFVIRAMYLWSKGGEGHAVEKGGQG